MMIYKLRMIKNKNKILRTKNLTAQAIRGLGLNDKASISGCSYEVFYKTQFINFKTKLQ